MYEELVESILCFQNFDRCVRLTAATVVKTNELYDISLF